MNKEEKKLVSEINKKTDREKITWKVGGKENPPHEEIGTSNFPFVARCGGVDLMLYEQYGYPYLKISKSVTSTTLEIGFFSGFKLRTLLETVDRLVREPILKERKKCLKEKERRQQAERQAERKSLVDQLAKALKKTK